MADQCSTLADQVRAIVGIIREAEVDIMDPEEAHRLSRFLREGMLALEQHEARRKKWGDRIWALINGSFLALLGGAAYHLWDRVWHK